jgi:hypothetical protein
MAKKRAPWSRATVAQVRHRPVLRARDGLKRNVRLLNKRALGDHHWVEYMATGYFTIQGRRVRRTADLEFVMQDGEVWQSGEPHHLPFTAGAKESDAGQEERTPTARRVR